MEDQYAVSSITVKSTANPVFTGSKQQCADYISEFMDHFMEKFPDADRNECCQKIFSIAKI